VYKKMYDDKLKASESQLDEIMKFEKLEMDN
jgi:hypothetical protein